MMRSRTQPYRSTGFESHRVVVQAVETERALVLELHGRNELSIPLTAPGGLLPIVGDIWTINGTGATWAFDRCLSRNLTSRQPTLRDVLFALEKAGLIRWAPEIGEDDMSIHGLAYVGEARLFPTTTTPRGWLPVNGSTQSVTRWRRLFRKIGTTHGGNGTTTFVMPTIASPPAGFHWLMCAE